MAEARLRSGTTNQIDHTPASAVAIGEVVLINDFCALATRAISASVKGALTIGGVWECTAASADTWSAGADLYWDNTYNRVTTTVGSNKWVGKSVAAKTSGQTTADVIHCIKSI